MTKVKLGNKTFNITSKTNLGEVIADLTIYQPNLKMTADEFFDKIGLSKDLRSDFLLGAILKNAYDILEKEWDKKPINKEIERIIKEAKSKLDKLGKIIEEKK